MCGKRETTRNGRGAVGGMTGRTWRTPGPPEGGWRSTRAPVSATCVRVPVYTGHSEAIHAEFTKMISPEDFTSIVRDAPGVTVQDDPPLNLYPTPWQVAGRDDTYVGRIRQDASHPNGIALWLVSDNLRKGAALNAIQIAEELVGRGLV